MDIEEAFRENRENMVRSITAFCGDEEAAQDGVSHAFTQALARRVMLEAMPEPAMKAWLYAAARNAVIDIKRREIRFSPIRHNGDVDFADPRQEDTAGRIAVELLLEKLPDMLRVPVELKYYGNMNSTEIGEMMNLPSATVRTRLRAAMTQMRNG